MARILIIDDQQHIRRGLIMRLELEPDLQIVGETGDEKAALEMAEMLQPDLILLDLEVGENQGLVTASLLRERLPGCLIVMLALQEDEETRQKVQQAGAVAFVSKREMDHVLMHTIYTITAFLNRQ
jgi:two-component system, NarL family, nitrate/nitrite response regulator NarL